MEVKGKIRLFVKELKAKEGRHFKIFSTSFSSKNEDGSYTNKSMEVRFNKEKYPEEKLNKLSESKMYELEVESAWISVRSYKKDEIENRVFYLFIDECKFVSSKDIEVSKPNDDLPF